MTENNVSKNIPDNMDVVIIIDKEKLPKDVLEQLKLSQEKILKMSDRPPLVLISNIENKSNNKLDDKIKLENKSNNKLDDKIKLEDNRLFAIQTGTVVGNIYTDGIYKKEEDTHIKNKDIKDLGGCC